MKKLYVLCIMVLLSSSILAQEEDRTGFQKENLFFGGNFGLSFGSSATFLNLSPQIGYRFSETFSAGAGINGMYSSYNRNAYKEKFGVAGLNVFGRVFPIKNLFLQLQPELNYVWGKYQYQDERNEVKLEGKAVPSVIGGVGGVLPAGGRGGMMIMLQYDLLQNGRSPYSNRPFFNIGYVVGL